MRPDCAKGRFPSIKALLEQTQLIAACSIARAYPTV